MRWQTPLFLSLVAPLAAGCGSSNTTTGSGGSGATTTSSSTSSSVGSTGSGGAQASSSTSSSSTGGAGGGGGAAPEPAGIFVAVGDGGRRIRSLDDGVTWVDDVSLTPSGGDDFVGLRTVTFGNGLFVAAGWRVMTSPDGVTWMDYPPNVFNQNWIGQMGYGAGQYVGLGGYGSRVSSPDGSTWKQNSIDTAASHAQGALAYAKGRGFVAINDDGKISTSPDGVAWQYTTTTVGTQARAVAHGNGLFVVVSDTGVTTSTDGATWSSPTSFPDPGLRSLVFAQGHFTAITPEHVYTSMDGSAWMDHPVKGLFVYLAGYGHGTYVAFDVTRVRRSSDGLTWTDPQELGGMNGISWVAFGPK